MTRKKIMNICMCEKNNKYLHTKSLKQLKKKPANSRMMRLRGNMHMIRAVEGRGWRGKVEDFKSLKRLKRLKRVEEVEEVKEG